MKYLKAIIPLALVVIIGSGIITMLGKKVSSVFSSVNPGLGGESGSDSSYSYGLSDGEASKSSERFSIPPSIVGAPSAGDTTTFSRGQPRTAPRAGEVDDNRDFAPYLDYMQGYTGPPIHQVDVSDRIILTVVNQDQQPVLDAQVRLVAGEQELFVGRTYAGGQTLMLPRTFPPVSTNLPIQMLIQKGQSSVQVALSQGHGTITQTVVLPGVQPFPPRVHLDVLFLLDATGSMGDEIRQLQHSIGSIAQRLNEVTPAPDVRFGLVAYRDRGDEYVTKTYTFTRDLGTFQTNLQGIAADGGNDTPEALNQGLHAALAENQWADDAVRLIFLVADAPPHLDYADDYEYVTETQHAVAAGIKIYPIAASNSDAQAEYVFRQLAQQTLARFIFLTYQPGESSGTPGDSTTLHVAPEQFTVEQLDDLVVRAVQRELAQAQGSR